MQIAICIGETTRKNSQAEERPREHFMLLSELRSALISGVGSFRWSKCEQLEKVLWIHKKLIEVVQQAMLIAFCVYLIRLDGTKANHHPETIKLYACKVKSIVNYVIVSFHPMMCGFFFIVLVCQRVCKSCHSSGDYLTWDEAAFHMEPELCR